MQIIKSSATTLLSHIPRWLKWFLISSFVLVPVLIFLYPYAQSADQVLQSYQSALTKRDYKTAYQYLDHRYPGLTYEAFQQWQGQIQRTNSQIAVHKVPLFLNVLYIWRVDLPTKYITLQLPFPNVTVSIDGILYQIASTDTNIPLIMGTHTLSVQSGGLDLGKQTIDVAKNSGQQTISISPQPSSEFASTVKTFLTQYNKTWYQAVDLRIPDGILPFLSGRSSSEYRFLVGYIQTIAKQDWVSDMETLKDLQITKIQFADATHLNVTTNEVYHHVLQVLKDHDNWPRGEKKQYDSTASWTYKLKIINSQTLQIESLSRPLQ